MKSIKQIFEVAKVSQEREVVKNVDWTNNVEKVVKMGFDKVDALQNELKQMFIDDARKFYAANPRARRYDGNVSIYVKYSYVPADGEDDLYKKLKVLMDDLSCKWFNFCDSNKDIGYIRGSVQLSSKKELDDPSKIKVKIYTDKNDDRKYNEANFHQGLPSKTTTEIREKLLACIDGAEIVINRKYLNRVTSITYHPIYNVSKVKKLIKELESNPEFIEYIEYRKESDKGLLRYYDELGKRNGYSGD